MLRPTLLPLKLDFVQIAPSKIVFIYEHTSQLRAQFIYFSFFNCAKISYIFLRDILLFFFFASTILPHIYELFLKNACGTRLTSRLLYIRIKYCASSRSDTHISNKRAMNHAVCTFLRMKSGCCCCCCLFFGSKKISALRPFMRKAIAYVLC